ncbi:hypothetical protein K438DRAFT_1934151 [Mycena galopus ATCC 62051]|nr:hypothetical protein K438DRAFT_1934151 [Mycena galopus ATCC 62051]
MFTSLVVAAFVASVSAIQILTPGPGSNWLNNQSNIVTWSSVDTDPLNFTIVLINKNTTTAPVPQQLDALVVTSLDHTTVSPPSEGWPAVGGNYFLQFLLSTENTTQLAESQAFAINAPAVSSSSATPTLPPSTPVAPTEPATNTGTSDSSSAAPSTSPSGTSAALSNMGVHTGLVGAFVLLSAILAL